MDRSKRKHLVGPLLITGPTIDYRTTLFHCHIDTVQFREWGAYDGVEQNDTQMPRIGFELQTICLEHQHSFH